MSAGKLSVSPLTIHGLDQNGFPTSQTFIGCYVSQAEKQRTNSAPGPQPHFRDTLTYNVTESNDTLYLDVVNEDPSQPGLIGSGQLPLKSVIDSGRFEDWVPLQASSGGHLGHLYMKLSYTASSSDGSPATSPYGVPPTMDAPPTPTPTDADRDMNAAAGGVPPYNPNASYTGGSAASFNPVGAGAAPLATPPLGTPPVAAIPATKPKKEIPAWMKYGGAALAGGAAVGLGAWALNEFNSDEEEEEAKQAYEAQQAQAQAQSQMSENPYATPAPPQEEYYGSRGMAEGEDEDAYEARRREEEERYEERRREEEERYQRHLEEMEQAVEDAEQAASDAEEAAEEAEEAAEEAEEAAEEAEEAAEEAEEAASDASSAASDAEEAAEEAEEAAEEAEEAAEEAEEAQEEADEAAEEVAKLSIDDSKWR